MAASGGAAFGQVQSVPGELLIGPASSTEVTLSISGFGDDATEVKYSGTIKGAVEIDGADGSISGIVIDLIPVDLT